MQLAFWFALEQTGDDVRTGEVRSTGGAQVTSLTIHSVPFLKPGERAALCSRKFSKERLES